MTSTLGVENHPTWSPDGVRLAYEAGELLDHDIWVAQLGSGEPVNLTADHPGDDALPSWSPDGRHIAFFSNRGNAWGVYMVPAIGGSPRNVLSLPSVSIPRSPPEWSSDGTTLAVSVQQAGDSVVLLLSLSSLETNRIVMPTRGGNVLHGLSWSPDGRRFAYVEARQGGAEVTRLWTIPTSGGEGFPLTDGRTLVRSPSWSTDGRKLFYVSNRVGSMDLGYGRRDGLDRIIGRTLAILRIASGNAARESLLSVAKLRII